MGKADGNGVRRAPRRAMLTSLALIGLGIGTALQAATPMSRAQKLHRLDVMLKLAGARCRETQSDLRPEYTAFARNHRFALGQASREVRLELAGRYGATGADRAYDRLNLTLTDAYRQRHPWLSCQDLKVAAHGLAMVEGAPTLLEAADQILPEVASHNLGGPHGD